MADTDYSTILNRIDTNLERMTYLNIEAKCGPAPESQDAFEERFRQWQQRKHEQGQARDREKVMGLGSINASQPERRSSH